MSEKTFRNTKQRVKTAKGRKISSTSWLHRHLNDEFVNRAKQSGYRSRAAYKLLEIIEKFRLIDKHQSILDLGCAPGSWLQVLLERVPKTAKIYGIDLKEIEPIERVNFIQGDFLKFNFDLSDLPQRFDLILSDMAPNACGDKMTDHLKIVTLVEEALNFVVQRLEHKGNFVAKLLKGKDEQSIFKFAKSYFSEVKYYKPKASYESSSEVYLICLGFKRN